MKTLNTKAFKAAKRRLRPLGVRLSITDCEEYRVSIGREASAYYTTDLGDAVGTAVKMIRCAKETSK
jgi:hypothetical protein